eukprot:m.116038 g.116038  ORF g.116038 m.116038 type:complete len:234 (-) comp9179_c0_seq5:4036-4737(-)
MINQLSESLAAAGSNSAVRVVVLTGAPPVFSAGHDLRELLPPTPGGETPNPSAAAIFSACSDLMLAIRNLPVPVVASVSGLATAAGCQLAATCDITIAAESAHFQTPGLRVGLFCSTPGVAIARAMLPKQALSMLLTADAISAAEALQYGLVTKVVPDGELQTQTLAIAKKVAANSRQVLALGKRAFYDQIQRDCQGAYTVANAAMVSNLQLGDAREGIGAFLGKRAPQWSHA